MEGENGVVYCVSKHGDYIVGYYAEEEPGILTVRCRADKEIIGYVSKDMITLTREGECSRFKKMGYPKSPNTITWQCAERFSNCICDLKDSECIALCEEDNWEAGAAFVCMHYDAAATMHTEFHNFWCSWL